MPNISVVVPHVSINSEFDAMLNRCISSLNDYNELILVINEGAGYATSFNRGFKYAKGEFIMGISNDTVLAQGNLRDLYNKDAVTYSGNSQWGCFFCLPRWVYEKIGGFDERIGKGYFEDDNYLSRLTRAGIPLKRIESIQVDHAGGATIKALGKEAEYMASSRPIYLQIEQELNQGASLYVPPCGNACRDKPNCQYPHL